MQKTVRCFLVVNTALVLTALLAFDLAHTGMASPQHSGHAGVASPQHPGRPRSDSGRASPPMRFLTLHLGDKGAPVREVQKYLNELGFNSGPSSSEYGPALRTAVWAFQKVNGLPPVDQVDLPTWRALSHPARIKPLVRTGGPTRVEIDLHRQLLTAWKDDKPVLVSHISTGNGKAYCKNGRCGVAITPIGDFRAWYRTPGWTTGPLGSQFYTVYFNGGIGFHGSERVPRHPASHGCIRLPLHNAKPLFNMTQTGQPVYVRRPEQDVDRLKADRD